MLVVHRGSVGLDPVYLVPQLCLLYPLTHAACQIAQCAPASPLLQDSRQRRHARIEYIRLLQTVK